MFKFCAVIAFVLNLQATTCDDDCDKLSKLSSDGLISLLRSLALYEIERVSATCGAKFCNKLSELSDEQLTSVSLSTIKSLAATCGGKFCTKYYELNSKQLANLKQSTFETLCELFKLRI